jgi:uncharacterized protein (DUF433 family)
MVARWAGRGEFRKIKEMNAEENPYLAGVVIRPDVRSGRPCIHDTRITIQEILRWLGGATVDEILNDYPYLEKDDFRAVLHMRRSFPIRASRLCESSWSTRVSRRKDETILILRA